MLRLADILTRVEHYHPAADLDQIKKAYVFAAKAHDGQLRKSGDPYVVHPLSVASLIGFITVFGIAARNGIMLVTHVRHLQLVEGVTSLRDAVRRGALERVAPILMTALAAGLALVPLALAREEPGNELQSPMAVVILGGLLTSTLLNMLVVPAIYLRFGRPATPDSGAVS